MSPISTQSAALDHLNLTVHNFNDSAKWYQEIFGFKIVEKGKMPDGSPWGVLRNGDTMLCLYEENRKSTPRENKALDEFHRIYHFGLRLTDRAQWEKLISDKNLKVRYGGAVQYPFSSSWYVSDPSGHEIEIVIWNDNQVRFKQ